MWESIIMLVRISGLGSHWYCVIGIAGFDRSLDMFAGSKPRHVCICVHPRIYAHMHERSGSSAQAGFVLSVFFFFHPPSPLKKLSVMLRSRLLLQLRHACVHV
jgi:hypothetical protein